MKELYYILTLQNTESHSLCGGVGLTGVCKENFGLWDKEQIYWTITKYNFNYIRHKRNHTFYIFLVRVL